MNLRCLLWPTIARARVALGMLGEAATVEGVVAAAAVVEVHEAARLQHAAVQIPPQPPLAAM